MMELSDEELRGKTKEFKERLAEGQTLDDILVEAFAAVREAARRVLGMEHYRVQLIGGIILHQGRIAEMKTLLFVNHHVVTEIIKAQLVVGHIGDVAVVGCPAFVVGIAVQHHAYGEAKGFVNLAHPLWKTKEFKERLAEGQTLDDIL